MTNDASRHLQSIFSQSPTARIGVTNSRISESVIPRVAQVLHEHGYCATLRNSGSLHVRVSTTRFSAHVLPETNGSIEVRAHREGRRSILGLVADPDTAAHLLIECAGMAQAFELVGDIYDRLVLADDSSALCEVPMGNTVFVRLGERTYAELVADDADSCVGQPATVSVTTRIARHSLDEVWRFRCLKEGDLSTVARIAGGTFTVVDDALAAVQRHRTRTREWESLH